MANHHPEAIKKGWKENFDSFTKQGISKKGGETPNFDNFPDKGVTYSIRGARLQLTIASLVHMSDIRN